MTAPRTVTPAERPPASDMRDKEITVVVIAIAGRDVTPDIGGDAPALIFGTDGILRDGSGGVVRQGEERSVPRRRELAARCVETPFVAFLEDTVTPDPGWLDAAVAALGGGAAAVGGPVLISTALPARYRALGLTEYARFHPANAARLATEPTDATGVRVLPGCNFAFRTDALLAALDRPDGGLIDNEVFAELHRTSQALAWHPAMQVTYDHRHEAGARLRTRFRHGRLYAGRAYAGAGAPRRIAGMLKALALPLVLFRRTLAEALRSRQATAGTLACAAAMHLAWSMGELAGAARGATQDEVEQWT